MNPEDQIKTLAELDGVITIKSLNVETYALFDANQTRITDWHKDIDSCWEELFENPVDYQKRNPMNWTIQKFNYLTSYDAILPLIQKQDESVLCQLANHMLDMVEHIRESPVTALQLKRLLFTFTPAQLCEALLRATGKWKE